MLFFVLCKHVPRLTLSPWSQPAHFASWALRSSWVHNHNKENNLELHYSWGTLKCILNWFETNPIKRMKYSPIRSNWPKWSVSFQVHLPPTLQNKVESNIKRRTQKVFSTITFLPPGKQWICGSGKFLWEIFLISTSALFATSTQCFILILGFMAQMPPLSVPKSSSEDTIKNPLQTKKHPWPPGVWACDIKYVPMNAGFLPFRVFLQKIKYAHMYVTRVCVCCSIFIGGKHHHLGAVSIPGRRSRGVWDLLSTKPFPQFRADCWNSY